MGILGIVPISGELLRLAVKPTQSIFRPEPKHSGSILKDKSQSVGGFWIVPIGLESSFRGGEAIQPSALGGHPKHSLAVHHK